MHLFLPIASAMVVASSEEESPIETPSVGSSSLDNNSSSSAPKER